MTLDVTLVVPCFNEALRLNSSAFLYGLQEVPSMDYLFVDDGSTDDTLRVLNALAKQAPDRIDTLELAQNVGKAEAVRHGLLCAAGKGAELIGFWDADLATPLSEVARFAEFFEHDPNLVAVLGSRVQMLGRRIDRSTSRHLAGRVMASLISFTLGVPTYDTQCGAKLLRVDAPLLRALHEPFISRWVFDVELLARLREQYGSEVLSTRVIEAPVVDWHDVAGSKLRLRDGIGAVADLVRIRRRFRL